MTYQLANAKVWDGSAWVASVGSLPSDGDNVSGVDVLAICRAWTQQSPSELPWEGGTTTVDSQALGSYDWTWKNGNQTISTTQPFDWFTATQDTRSAWVIVDGDLTINAGMELRPTSRKLFTVVYVTGDLTCNGTISMTGRGANHSGTGVSGGATTAAAILIATGTFSTVVDPKVPAVGGAGGAAVSTSAAGNVGAAGTGGGTGGGGSGGHAVTAGTSTSGAGAAGTSFTGGSGGGGAVSTQAGTIAGGTGGANGGAGGDSAHNGNTIANGGAGNPGGKYTSSLAYANSPDGTGGVLIVIVEGALSGSGKIEANGVAAAQGVARAGGGSGGGSVTIMYGTDTSSITPTASSIGSAATASQPGGNGGAGTARKLAL